MPGRRTMGGAARRPAPLRPTSGAAQGRPPELCPRTDREAESLKRPFFESDQLERQRFEELVEHVPARLPRVARPVLDPVRPEGGEVSKRKGEGNGEPPEHC